MTFLQRAGKLRIHFGGDDTVLYFIHEIGGRVEKYEFFIYPIYYLSSKMDQ